MQTPRGWIRFDAVRGPAFRRNCGSYPYWFSSAVGETPLQSHLTIPATADTRRALATGFKLVGSSGMPVFQITLHGRSIIQATVALEKFHDKKQKAAAVRRVPGKDLFWLPSVARYAHLSAGLDGTIIRLVRPDCLSDITNHETK